MSIKDMVISVLADCGCQNSYQIKGSIYRKFGEVVTQSAITGAIRTLYNQSLATRSADGSGKMVYWLTDYGKEKLIK